MFDIKNADANGNQLAIVTYDIMLLRGAIMMG
jgi:hypothetical protein